MSSPIRSIGSGSIPSKAHQGLRATAEVESCASAPTLGDDGGLQSIRERIDSLEASQATHAADVDHARPSPAASATPKALDWNHRRGFVAYNTGRWAGLAGAAGLLGVPVLAQAHPVMAATLLAVDLVAVAGGIAATCWGRHTYREDGIRLNEELKAAKDTEQILEMARVPSPPSEATIRTEEDGIVIGGVRVERNPRQ